MAFVLETGAGLSTATSYVSVAEADAYFLQFGNADWPTTDLASEDAGAAVIANKQKALNRATRAIDLLFGQRFASYPSFPTVQSLLFPRATFYINSYQSISGTTIPRLLKDAVCEIAVLSYNDTSATGDGIYPDINSSASIKREKVKIGEMEMDVEYSGSATYETLTGFYKIELLLAPLLARETVDAVPSFLAL